MRTSKEIIAQRAAKELKNGDIVNLGIGLPTMIPKYLSKDVEVFLHSENGFIGLKEASKPNDINLADAGGMPAGIIEGGAFFDSLTSFSLIRGGHLDVTILGGLQVDQQGNLANWIIPNKLVPGMGGAMDLVVGAKKVIITMEHTTKSGEPKILKECVLPLTAMNVVTKIITDLAVFSFKENQLYLEEVYSHSSIDKVKEKTEAEFLISENLIVGGK